jgi:hypothetical protein
VRGGEIGVGARRQAPTQQREVGEGPGSTDRRWAADSSPDMVLAVGAGSAPKQGRWGAARWGHDTVPSGAGQKWFKQFPKFKWFKHIQFFSNFD